MTSTTRVLSKLRTLLQDPTHITQEALYRYWLKSSLVGGAKTKRLLPPFKRNWMPKFAARQTQTLRELRQA